MKFVIFNLIELLGILRFSSVPKMNIDSLKFRQIFAYCSFFIALIYVSFLYLFPTQLPKYLIFFFSLLSIVFGYKDVLCSTEGRKDVVKFFTPWIPWLIGVTILCFVHGPAGSSRYINTFLILILSFLAIKQITINRIFLFYVLAISSIVVSFSICCYIQRYGLTAEILGYNKNKLMYPVTMVSVCCIMALFTGYKNMPKSLAYLLGISVLFSIVTLAMSEVRGALLGYLALIPVFLLNIHRIPKQVLVIFIVVIAVAVGLFFLTGRMQVGFTDLEKFTQGDSNSSWGIRLVLWSTSFESFLASPWFGWGPDTYHAYSVSGLMTSPLPSFIGFTHFHSDFFQLLAAGGAIGISTWLCTCLWLAWSVRQDPCRLALLFSVIAMGLTEPCWTRWSSLFSFAILWVLLTLLGKFKQSKTE